MGKTIQRPRIAVITPTYGPDIGRCRLLVDSIDRWVVGVDEHLIIGDEGCLADLSDLRSPQRRVIAKEALVPWSARRVPMSRRWWLRAGRWPMRGWIFQQIAKLAAVDAVDADYLVFVDSDVAFVRPFDLRSLIADGAHHFRRQLGPVQRADRRYCNWYQTARAVLGLESGFSLDHGYIAQLNVWDRTLVLGLQERIEHTAQRRWHQHLAGCLDFSEFVLYGAYVEHCVDQHDHHWSDQPPCHSSWFYRCQSRADLNAFCDALEPHHAAIHLQSNLGFSALAARDVIELATQRALPTTRQLASPRQA